MTESAPEPETDENGTRPPDEGEEDPGRQSD